jgi:hypothetical protein
MKRSPAAIMIGSAAVAALILAACQTPQKAANAGSPQIASGAIPLPAMAFDTDGKLLIPEGRDRWPAVGTTFALSYEGDGGTTFNTVRMDPASYEAYVKTGKFPVGTMLDLEVRRPVTEEAPAKGGQTQGAAVGRSIHVKDEKAGPGTWTFYGFGAGAKTGNAIPRSQACYACHDEHAGKTDTVFMQFYPSLREAQAVAAAKVAGGQ